MQPPFGFWRFLPAWSPTVAVLAVIVWLTLGKPPEIDDDIPMWEHADKVVHALMFGTLFMVMCFDWYRSHPAAVPRWFGIEVSAFFAWSCVAGAAIEIIQPSFGRTCDLWDFAADVAGVTLAWILMPRFIKAVR